MMVKDPKSGATPDDDIVATCDAFMPEPSGGAGALSIFFWRPVAPCVRAQRCVAAVCPNLNLCNGLTSFCGQFVLV